MKIRSEVRKSVGILMLGLAMLPACSAPSGDTGPADEPSKGPGMPAGGKTPPNFKPGQKGETKAAPAPAAKSETEK